MTHKHLSRRELLKAAGVAALGSAVLSNVTVLAQKDPTKADLEIKMGEFYFQVPGKDKNAPIELQAGKELLIKFVNEGKVAHEAHFGRNFDSTKRLYKEDLMPGFLGLHLEPNQVGYLHILLPEKQKGEWELGCLISGHYEAGQKAKLVVK
uniref:Uncharacterized protein n=1 Tax=Acetithermum autotrophicum TaxID=1446466 RepID=H5SUY0_ACEAU|nr:hypothetical protein HGMM_OP4C045 [Candidatus Acetothermum autotrophicum]